MCKWIICSNGKIHVIIFKKRSTVKVTYVNYVSKLFKLEKRLKYSKIVILIFLQWHNEWDFKFFIIFSEHYLTFKKRFYLFVFSERGREGEREAEKHWWTREISLSCPTRDLAPTLACALTRNRNSDLSVCGPVLSSLSHTSQGSTFNFYHFVFRIKILLKI